MRLHTDFRDYYDTAVGYGIDGQVHYNRFTEEAEIRVKPRRSRINSGSISTVLINERVFVKKRKINSFMSTKKDILLKQFTVAYDENGWFVALKNALQNLTAQDAAWKPDKLDNSIWEILAHLNFYNRAYVERFKGVDYVYPVNDNDATFAGADEVSEEAWHAEVGRFNEIMTEWRGLIETTPDAKFDEPVSASNKAHWDALLSHVNLHNAHHGGQIVLIRKLQGSWDASKGVS